MGVRCWIKSIARLDKDTLAWDWASRSLAAWEMVTVSALLRALGAGVLVRVDAAAANRVGSALAGVAVAYSRRLAWMCMRALVVRTHRRVRWGNHSHNHAVRSPEKQAKIPLSRPLWGRLKLCGQAAGAAPGPPPAAAATGPAAAAPAAAPK